MLFALYKLKNDSWKIPVIPIVKSKYKFISDDSVTSCFSETEQAEK